MKKTKVGSIVKKIDGKTIKVKVERRLIHSRYKKVVKVSKFYLVHNPDDLGNLGEKVIIQEGRPYSKLKTWRVKEIVSSKG